MATNNHDFTKYSIYDTDADNKDLILLNDKKNHFDRRGPVKIQSTADEESKDGIKIPLHTVRSEGPDGGGGGTNPTEPKETGGTGSLSDFKDTQTTEAPGKKKVKKHYVKKNYIDPTAGF
jgi:hypothetical protein